MAKASGGQAVESRSGWMALAAFLLFTVFAATILPRQAGFAEQFTGAAGSPDTSFLYSQSDLYSMAEA